MQRCQRVIEASVGRVADAAKSWKTANQSAQIVNASIEQQTAGGG